MGIYAQDDSGTEILYAYNKGTDGDYIPVYNGKNAIDIVEKCIIIIDQAANLNVTIDNSMTYLTRESADRRYLEIQALAKIIGLEFGGNIQDTGTKTTGKFYFDNVTKFYYECIADTNLTYNESSKFRAISNKPLSDKLEDLYEVIPGTLNASQIAGFSSATLYKKAGVVFLNVDDNQRLNGRTAGNVILTLPDGFRPRNRTSFSGNTSLGKACVFNVETDGRVILMSDIKLSGYLYFNVSFLAK